MRLRPLWLTLGWSGVATVFWLSLTASPPAVSGVEVNDKVGHFLAYACLMGWFGQLYHGQSMHNRYGIGFIAMGAGLEVLQWFGGLRYFELADMLANTTGVLVSWLWLRAGFTGALLRLESLLFRP